MKSAGKARNNGLYRHIRTSKEIIRNLLNDSINNNQEGDSFCCRPLDCYLFPRFGFLSDNYNLDLVQNARNCRNQ